MPSVASVLRRRYLILLVHHSPIGLHPAGSPLTRSPGAEPASVGSPSRPAPASGAGDMPIWRAWTSHEAVVRARRSGAPSGVASTTPHQHSRCRRHDRFDVGI